MSYRFTETQKNKIIEKQGNDFYLQVLQALEICLEKWQLSELSFYEYYSVSSIFFCKSETYGDCVLKIYDDDEIEVEYNALCEYNGGYYIKAFEYEKSRDTTWGAMLIERAVPGKRLKEEPSLEKRLAVFSELFSGGHIEAKKPEIYRYYSDWFHDSMSGIINKREEREDSEELYVHVLKAKVIVEISMDAILHSPKVMELCGFQRDILD